MGGFGWILVLLLEKSNLTLAPSEELNESLKSQIRSLCFSGSQTTYHIKSTAPSASSLCEQLPFQLWHNPASTSTPTMRSFMDLPVEMISQVISYSLVDNSHPLSILAVNSTFYAISLPIIHADINLASFSNIESFTDKEFGANLPKVPNSLDIHLPGGQANKRLWILLRKVFQRCTPPHLTLLSRSASVSDDDETSSNSSYDSSNSDDSVVYFGQQHIQDVRLTLNTLASDPSMKFMSKALNALK